MDFAFPLEPGGGGRGGQVLIVSRYDIVGEESDVLFNEWVVFGTMLWWDTLNICLFRNLAI